jgi:hypothetical protein
MRGFLLSLFVAALQFRNPNPDAVAATADWQINNEPIVAQGLTYYPTRESRMFDGQVMSQIDVYKGVPVYADVSISPFTLAYVPLTPTRMRTYERGPDGDSRFISGRGRADLGAVGTSGIEIWEPVIIEAPIEAPSAPPAPTRVESIPRPRGTTGIWVEFNGVRWYNDGVAQSYTAERFVRAGDYHGFPVYRERGRAADRIWIATLNGGPLTPYRKH